MENWNKSAVTLTVAAAFVFLLSFGPATGLHLQQGTDAAIEEMSGVLRTLFPLMPEHTHVFWKSDQLGAATVHRTTSLKSSNLIKSAPRGRYSSRMLPWLQLQVNYNKRGPDCMGKCINQGVLHPLQCHSLC